MLILSANVGEGHASAARSLAGQLDAGPEVDAVIVDGLAGLGRVLHHVIEAGFNFQLRTAPWAYAITYGLLMRVAPVRWIVQRLLFLIGSRPLARLIAEHDPDVIVSTYPATTVVLGGLRQRAIVAGPAYAAITDLTGLFFWAHKGIDMHLIVYRGSRELVERIAGPGSALHVAPLVGPEFFLPGTARTARARLKLPDGRRIIVVSGGGWGVGDLDGAVRESLKFDDVSVVVMAGRNDDVKRELEDSFGSDPRVRVLGFSGQVRDLLVAADLLIHATGGVTVVEAALCGCPSISYGLPVGHVLHNTRAMAELGLTGLAESRMQLASELQRHLSSEPIVPLTWETAESAQSFVLSGEKRIKPRPAWRAAALNAATATLMVVLAVNWTLSSDDAFSLAAHVLPIRPLSATTQNSRDVGLVIDAPVEAVPRIEAVLRKSGQHASFAIHRASSGEMRATPLAAGDGVILDFDGAGMLGWLKTRATLKRFRRDSATTAPTFFVSPPNGLTVGEYVLAKTVHARALRPSVTLNASQSNVGPAPRSGALVDLTIASGSTAELRSLASLLASLRKSGLSAVSASELLDSRPAATVTARDEASTVAPAAMIVSAAITTPPDNGVSPRCSPASTAARVTGTSISITNTTGATRVAGTRCNAVISLSNPTIAAAVVATTQIAQTSHA